MSKTIGGKKEQSRKKAPAAGGAALYVVVGLDVFFDNRWQRGQINMLPGDVYIRDRCFHLEGFSEEMLRLFQRLSLEGIKFYLFSPFSKSDSRQLMARLKEKSEGGLLPPLIAKAGREGYPFYRNMVFSDGLRHDQLLASALKKLGAPLNRTVVIDHRESTQEASPLDACRIRQWRGKKFLDSHLLFLAGLKGDLRRKDLTLHYMDYDSRGQEEMRQWATNDLVYPEGARAKSGKERILCLDLDETLIHTDEKPLSDEGRQAYAALLTMHGFNTTAEELDKRIRPHDHVIGDHGLWVRPGLADFMKEARLHFDRLCIYTAARRLYAEKILEKILPSELRPDFILTDTHTFYRSREERRGKSLLVLEALGYHPSQILMVDDRPKSYSYSRMNLIEVSPYTGETEDSVLAQLTELVRQTKGVRDLRRGRFPRQLQTKKK